jgi:hypothetical protein
MKHNHLCISMIMITTDMIIDTDKSLDSMSIQTAFYPIHHIHAFVYTLRYDRCAITIDALQYV